MSWRAQVARVGADQLAAWVAQFSYPAVFALLVACGLGAPISEELVLITGGLVVAHGHGHLAWMLAIGYVGVLAGDLLLYRIGKRVGPAALQNKRLKKILSPKRVAWIEGHFRRHGAKTLFTARFLPGLRAATYLVAGISRFSTRKFIVADALAALISAPLLVLLGFKFGVAVLHEVKLASRWILLGAAIALLVTVVYKMTKRQRRVARGEADAAAAILRAELRSEQKAAH